MERVEISQAKMRKRKMLLFLPLLVVPFLTLLFWALGGGKGEGDAEEKQMNGLNLALPNATLKDEKDYNKLSFYDLAQKDSIKLAERLTGDPFWKGADTGSVVAPSVEEATGSTAEKYRRAGGLNTTPYGSSNRKPEDQLLEKLALLQKGLEESAGASVKETNKKPLMDSEKEALSGQVDRLEGMMRLMNRDEGDDSEMNKIDAVMDKILDIQHPDRVKERIKEKSVLNKEKVYPVTASPFRSSVSLLDTGGKRMHSSNQFYGIEKMAEGDESFSVEAVVHQSQTLVDGAVTKLRLASDVFVNGSLVPKGTFVYGIANLNGERLEVEIPSIRSGSSLFPVGLQVYDMDGLAGIYIPGAITREVAKGSLDNAAQMLEVTSLDPSLKAQATNAGISAAKTLLSKKAKLINVVVKAGYKVLLKEK